MVSIGVRCGSSEVYYIIIEGSIDEPNDLSHNKLKHPANLQMHEALAWYREQLHALLNEFNVQCCGLRTSEPIAKSMGASAREGAIKRNYLDSIVMEAVASKGLPLLHGPMATLSAALETPKAKKFLDDGDFRGIKVWGRLSKEYKEAALAGTAALKLLEC